VLTTRRWIKHIPRRAEKARSQLRAACIKKGDKVICIKPCSSFVTGKEYIIEKIDKQGDPHVCVNGDGRSIPMYADFFCEHFKVVEPVSEKPESFESFSEKTLRRALRQEFQIGDSIKVISNGLFAAVVDVGDIGTIEGFDDQGIIVIIGYLQQRIPYAAAYKHIEHASNLHESRRKQVWDSAFPKSE